MQWQERRRQIEGRGSKGSRENLLQGSNIISCDRDRVFLVFSCAYVREYMASESKNEIYKELRGDEAR